MKVLLTGGSGFIGRMTIAPLVDAGVDLHIVARGAPDASTGGIWHRADLLNADEIRYLVTSLKPDIVVHLAWCVEHGHFWSDPANLDWVAATANLIRAAAEAGASRFVGVGTCYEYDWPAAGDCNELTTSLAAHTLYDAAKDASRRVMEMFCADNQMSFAWARLFFLYGPGENPARLVSSVASALVRDSKAKVSRGLAVRDFMDVRDVGAALAKLALSQVKGAINIASGEGVRISDLVLKMGDLAGCPDLINIGALPDRPGDPPRIVADTRRLREELGFRPSISLEQGLGDALSYWRARLI
ncbi:MAG: NAD(P)-dependent oxidoreductase [Parvibaculum sp.]|nr:NAD(P)-dependent oxidoreductase [Parvibaculum sp.]